MIEVINTITMEVVEKFLQIEQEISQEKGGFVLFALLEREDAPSKWDVLISAGWIDKKKKEALTYITKKISSKLLLSEQVLISRIVILEPSDGFVAQMNQLIEAEHEPVRFTNCTINEILLKDAFIITSKRPASVVNRGVFEKKKVGHNESCPCGSGKKYKKCHGAS